MMVHYCYLITGCNSGIGLEATRQLVAHLENTPTANDDKNSDNGDIYMLCRSKERAQEAIESIINGDTKRREMLSFLKFDGGDDAENMQKEIVDKLPKGAIVKGIILNAGGFGDGDSNKCGKTDGTLASPKACSIAKANLIGHAILINLLQKAEKFTKETRIVASGSEAAFATPINFDKDDVISNILTGTTKTGIPGADYGRIKAIVALYWGAFARHNPELFVVTVSPGSVPTTNLLQQGGVKPMLRGLSRIAMWVGGSHSEHDAAKRYLDAILDKQTDPSQQSGSFWASRKGYSKDYGDVMQSNLKNAKFVGDVPLQEKAWSAVNQFVPRDLN